MKNHIQTDFSQSMDYASYLSLDNLLGCQNPLSDKHDEMLFIIIHQTTELWMKLIIHELTAAQSLIAATHLEPAFKMLTRVARIQEQLIQSWNVLSTLTPADYLAFRDRLGSSSGFQSYQNRTIEFIFGYKDKEVLSVFKHRENLFHELQRRLYAPSLYDTTIGILHDMGFAIAPEVLSRDVSQRYEANESVESAWLTIYQDIDRHWDLYQLAEKLLDLEDRHQQWRFHHVQTVERIIGHKSGTGGSAGVAYLRERLSGRFFPELWSVRTKL